MPKKELNLFLCTVIFTKKKENCYMDEKRAEPRIKKHLKAEVHTDDGMTYSTSVDISYGGIFISTPDPAQQNAQVTLSLKLGEDTWRDISGIIKWTRDELDDTAKAGMGIQFKDLTADDKRAIASLLEA